MRGVVSFDQRIAAVANAVGEVKVRAPWFDSTFAIEQHFRH
jgi:hypothetical protein